MTLAHTASAQRSEPTKIIEKAFILFTLNVLFKALNGEHFRDSATQCI